MLRAGLGLGLGLLAGVALLGARDAAANDQCGPEAPCVFECLHHWGNTVQACIAEGQPRTVCWERGRVANELCVLERCEPGPGCEKRCGWRARHLYWRCIESGRDRAVCAEHSRAALETCIDRHCEPCLCPRIYDPVCGVDGMTYPNGCEARCAGVEVAHEGECREEMCRSNRDCPDGEVCHPVEHECMAECSIACLVPDPVCGVDGNTYPCGPEDAYCHGIDVAHPGPCRDVCLCPFIDFPVCGVDGNTYPSPCDARCAGVEVAYEGRCRCYGDGDCPAGQRCNAAEVCLPPPGCEAGGACPAVCTGFCVADPCVCPDVWAPVCGVDGQTYGNACEARCAGVEVGHEGECGLCARLGVPQRLCPVILCAPTGGDPVCGAAAPGSAPREGACASG